MFLAGPEFKNPPAGKLAWDFRPFDPGIFTFNILLPLMPSGHIQSLHVLQRSCQTWRLHFQASLKIQPDNPEAMFYVGRLYQESGDTENANAMFDNIVGEHGDSEYAQKASTARGY